MSGKIKGKDLSYDSSLPPFLQRLHAQHAGRGDSDRHEIQVARPKRVKEVNDEDDPVIVDESGRTVSKDEFAKLSAPESAVQAEVEGHAQEGEAASSVSLTVGNGDAESGAVKRLESKVTSGPAPKKRKAARVVGEEDSALSTIDSTDVRSKVPMATKKTKKAKVKLAFDDE